MMLAVFGFVAERCRVQLRAAVEKGQVAEAEGAEAAAGLDWAADLGGLVAGPLMSSAGRGLVMIMMIVSQRMEVERNFPAGIATLAAAAALPAVVFGIAARAREVKAAALARESARSSVSRR
mmetsp:Transcript_24248/g.51693  ORF Transcript_24248/g.51693 Transcript_24248/m.51693 type:complete len:122 (-) Transcript_24248:2-367(-)